MVSILDVFLEASIPNMVHDRGTTRTGRGGGELIILIAIAKELTHGVILN